MVQQFLKELSIGPSNSIPRYKPQRAETGVEQVHAHTGS